MRRMQCVVLLAVLALLATAVKAQNMRMTPEERVGRLVDSLSLTDDQKAKVLEIFKTSDEARTKAFEASQGDRDAMREAMQKIRTDTEAKMKAVLTADQFSKWQQMMPARQGRPRPGGQ